MFYFGLYILIAQLTGMVKMNAFLSQVLRYAFLKHAELFGVKAGITAGGGAVLMFAVKLAKKL